MGEQKVKSHSDKEQLQRFTRRLVDDVHALEQMISEGLFETGLRRVGAEQEVFLVDQKWMPASTSMELLAELDDERFTTELARFNLEFNLQPEVFESDCLSKMEKQLETMLQKLREVAADHDTEVVLTGILPTLLKSHLGLQNMTPRPRYAELDRALKRLRGDDYEFHIKGVDELILSHDSVMLEACNTSFQVHFQVDPQEFARLYNMAQLVTAPLLAAATNSPLLFGKRLWRETRIALFQQAVDTRRATSYLRESKGRVSFGTQWVKHSVLEIFKEDIARYRVLLGGEILEDPFEVLSAGGVPALQALRLFGGTVYRWNRPCYGILGGKAHLRIENRVLPSGPSIPDAVANAAFFFGLLSGLSDQFDDVSAVIPFSEVRENFLAAARHGLTAQFTWPDCGTLPAAKLICTKLIPLAREGLTARDIVADDVDRFLGIIEERVKTGWTGAQWTLTSLKGLGDVVPAPQRMAALTAACVRREKQGQPVHKWTPADLSEGGGWKPNFDRVEQVMTTDLVTVSEDETVDLVANLMEWNKVRHIPVEDEKHRLRGLISYRAVFRHFTEALSKKQDRMTTARELMVADPVTVTPETSILDAIECMRSNRIGSLPVVSKDRLVGILTERDFMNIARELIENSLRGSAPSDPL